MKENWGAAAPWGVHPMPWAILGSEEPGQSVKPVLWCCARRGGFDVGERLFPPPGLLAGTCFLLWLFSLHGVTGAYPPPTASPLRREWVWLSLAWKRHRFETISPPAGFSMESSIEDITIYSAQWVYTAWCPPAFQESIPPAWGGRAQLSWGDGALICPAWGRQGFLGG